MSTLRETILEKSRGRQRRIVKLYGENVICLSHPVIVIEEFRKIMSTELPKDKNGNADPKAVEDKDDKVKEFLAKQFLSPEDDKPIFTVEHLKEVMPNAELKNLLNLFFKTNGAEIDIGDIEKN